MKIRRRLQTIATMIEKGADVIDIGCDHAFLDIYLTLYNDNHCIASDINQNALNNAITNIKKYHLENNIQVIQSDGLEAINVKDKSTLIISGMGTTTIKHILSNPKVDQCETIIIQSNNELLELRKFLNKRYKIIEERIVVDRMIYYTVIKLVKGKQRCTKMDYYIGPYIRKNNIPLRKEYLEYLIETNQSVIDKLPSKYWLEKRKRNRLIHKLKKALNAF